MVQQPNRFGAELRRRRIDAGLTLTAMAKSIHYSKGQLSKVERGTKAPSRDLARLCDAVLATDGVLTGLLAPVAESGAWASSEPASGIRPADSTSLDTEVWSMQLSVNGESWFAPLGRRQLMTAGTASALSMGLSGSAQHNRPVGGESLSVFRSMFDQYRKLGQTLSPGLLIPALVAQTHVLREMAAQTTARNRREVLRLASRYAEYIGWLSQEAGSEEAALWWTQHAVQLAAASGDRDLAAYALVRRALVAMYREDSEQTIGLARQAQSSRLPARIRGLAAQREAQGHAIAGDYDACMRLLDLARVLLEQAQPDTDAPVIGSTNLANPADVIRGWCLYDLGRPHEAAQILDQQLLNVADGALRTRVRYGIRSALAHASAGDIDQACAAARSLLDSALAVGSATVVYDLRRLERVLARYPRSSSVRTLLPELSTSLHPDI